MSDFKPLTIDLWTSDASPAKLAAGAAAVLKDEDRVEVEPSAAGLVLHAVWDRDLDHVVDKLNNALDLRIEHGRPTVLYRKGTRILEPIMQVRISVPEYCVGDVIGDLNLRRGVIEEAENDDNDAFKIHVLMPLSNMFGYFSALQKMARGKGKIHVDFHSYEQVPPAGPDPDPNQPAAAALRVPRVA